MSTRGIVIASILGLGLLVGSCLFLKSCTKIDAGHVGVSVRKCSGGGVDDAPIPTGYYFKSVFCEDVVEYPTRMVTIILADNDNDKDNAAITVNSNEGLPISVDIAFSFTLDPSKVPGIYKKYRTDIWTITHSFMRQTIRESLQINFAKYTAEQIYADKKEVVRAAAQDFLSSHLGPEGIMVSQFTLNDVRVPEQVVNAINAKVAMTQDAQKAEAAVRKTQAEAAQRVAEAQGVADSLRLKADSEAYYNLTVSKSLTPEFLTYKAQEKWNGTLPQYLGGNGPVPFLQVGGGK